MKKFVLAWAVLVAGILVAASSMAAGFVPPVQRFISSDFQGHNGETDESARACWLDVTLLYPEPGGTPWVMLVLWSDFKSRLSFKPLIPTTLLPLRGGEEWMDGQGREYWYRNGILGTVDGGVRFEIDGHFLYPVEAEGQSEGLPGRSGSYLRCRFGV